MLRPGTPHPALRATFSRGEKVFDYYMISGMRQASRSSRSVPDGPQRHAERAAVVGGRLGRHPQRADGPRLGVEVDEPEGPRLDDLAVLLVIERVPHPQVADEPGPRHAVLDGDDLGADRGPLDRFFARSLFSVAG